MHAIKGMPAAERPRERLERLGAGALGTHELVAILLRTGTKGAPVLDVAEAIVAGVGGAAGLRNVTLAELAGRRGVGKTKAVVLLAALELGMRALHDGRDPARIAGAADVFALLRDELAPLRQETTLALYLDAKLRLIARETLFVGSLNQSLVHPREVFRFAVKHSAHQVLLVHNHPSGDPTPSPQDLDVTVRFREVGELLGIRLADHVVIAGDRYVSILEVLASGRR